MAGTDRRESIGIDRRASTRLSMHQQNDDDYDLEAMGISDGFRPGGVGMGHNRLSSQTVQNTLLTAGRRTPPPRPSSTTKPNNMDSFALRHDGETGDLQRNSSVASAVNPALPTRSSSVSTDVPYVRAESPYRGPAGPSHPYQMYPQESRLARTASIATTSTAAPPVTERSYAGPSGPTHPYGMYPQNIVPEGESTDTPAPAASVPVGFPGLNHNYQRRLGPDGEEIADIIGPDGHTEQLPPYTQYPDEALARKTRPTVAVPAVVPAAVPVAGAGGIGLATRNPEFASQENLNSPQSRRSVMSDLSSHQVNTAAMTISEKPELKKWQKVAKKKLCGIVPVWVLVLAATVLIIFVIILAVVLAVLKNNHPPPKHEQPKPHESGQAYVSLSFLSLHCINFPSQSEVYYTTMTTTFDATPVSAIPTGVSSLPTGTFALPINIPSGTQKSCLVNSAQSNAWSCIVSPNPAPLQLQITSLSDASNPLKNNGAVMTYGNNTIVSWTYGAQAPVVPVQQVMRLVTDSEDPDRGPAWWFQFLYNKLVVLREADIAMPASKRDVVERQAPGPGPVPSPGPGFHDTGDFIGKKGVAQPGDQPWFCYWNNTLLEAFIYVNQTSSSGIQTASSAPASTPTATTPSNSQPAAGTHSSSVPTSNVQSANSPYSGPSQQPYFLPAYPRVVKLEERRVPRGAQPPSPYCIQHIVQSDGSAIPIMNSTNQPVTLVLNETMPTMFSRRDFLERSLYERDDADTCGCAWEWT